MSLIHKKVSNTENKRKLMASAKKLFFDQGYHSTTVAQITEDCNVNNGLFTYYFGSKAQIAQEIRTEFMLNLRNEVARQLYLTEKSYSMAIGVAIETRINMVLKMENPKLLQFFSESEKDVVSPSVSPSGKREHYYQLQKRLINPNISEQDLKFYEVCGYCVMQGLQNAYASNYLACDIEEIADYAIRTLFHMLQLPAYQIEALVEQSSFLAQKISIRVGPGFQFL